MQKIAIYFMILLFLSSSGILADDMTRTGSVGAQFLKIAVGSRYQGMGESSVAVVNDAYSMYWNPAGLAGQSSGFWIEAKVLYPNTRITPDAPSVIPGSNSFYLYRNGVEQS